MISVWNQVCRASHCRDVAARPTIPATECGLLSRLARQLLGVLLFMR